jgi:hypothetical protein
VFFLTTIHFQSTPTDYSPLSIINVRLYVKGNQEPSGKVKLGEISMNYFINDRMLRTNAIVENINDETEKNIVYTGFQKLRWFLNLSIRYFGYFFSPHMNNDIIISKYKIVRDCRDKEKSPIEGG